MKRLIRQSFLALLAPFLITSIDAAPIDAQARAVTMIRNLDSEEIVLQSVDYVFTTKYGKIKVKFSKSNGKDVMNFVLSPPLEGDTGSMMDQANSITSAFTDAFTGNNSDSIGEAVSGILQNGIGDKNGSENDVVLDLTIGESTGGEGTDVSISFEADDTIIKADITITDKGDGDSSVSGESSVNGVSKPVDIEISKSDGTVSSSGQIGDSVVNTENSSKKEEVHLESTVVTGVNTDGSTIIKEQISNSDGTTTNKEIIKDSQGNIVSESTIVVTTPSSGSGVSSGIVGGEPLPDNTIIGDQNIVTNDYSNMDISGMDFSNKQLYSYNFENAKAVGTTFENSLTNGSNFSSTNLTDAILKNTNFGSSNLANANLTNADLSGALIGSSTLTGANFQDATISGANFSGATQNGFTSSQLYSTSDYGGGTLDSIDLSNNDLSGWNFDGKTLLEIDMSNTTASVSGEKSLSFQNAEIENLDISNSGINTVAVAGSAVGTDFSGANIRGLKLDASTYLVESNTQAYAVNMDYADVSNLSAVSSQFTANSTYSSDPAYSGEENVAVAFTAKNAKFKDAVLSSDFYATTNGDSGTRLDKATGIDLSGAVIDGMSIDSHITTYFDSIQDTPSISTGIDFSGATSNGLNIGTKTSISNTVRSDKIAVGYGINFADLKPNGEESYNILNHVDLDIIAESRAAWEGVAAAYGIYAENADFGQAIVLSLDRMYIDANAYYGTSARNSSIAYGALIANNEDKHIENLIITSLYTTISTSASIQKAYGLAVTNKAYVLDDNFAGTNFNGIITADYAKIESQIYVPDDHNYTTDSFSACGADLSALKVVNNADVDLQTFIGNNAPIRAKDIYVCGLRLNSIGEAYINSSSLIYLESRGYKSYIDYSPTIDSDLSGRSGANAIGVQLLPESEYNSINVINSHYDDCIDVESLNRNTSIIGFKSVDVDMSILACGLYGSKINASNMRIDKNMDISSTAQSTGGSISAPDVILDADVSATAIDLYDSNISTLNIYGNYKVAAINSNGKITVSAENISASSDVHATGVNIANDSIGTGHIQGHYEVSSKNNSSTLTLSDSSGSQTLYTSAYADGINATNSSFSDDFSFADSLYDVDVIGTENNAYAHVFNLFGATFNGSADFSNITATLDAQSESATAMANAMYISSSNFAGDVFSIGSKYDVSSISGGDSEGTRAISIYKSNFSGEVDFSDSQYTAIGQAGGNANGAYGAFALYVSGETSFAGSVDFSGSQYSAQQSGNSSEARGISFFETSFEKNVDLSDVNSTAQATSTDSDASAYALYSRDTTFAGDVTAKGSQYIAEATGGDSASNTTAIAINIDSSTFAKVFDFSDTSATATSSAVAKVFDSKDTIFNGDLLLNGAEYSVSAQSDTTGSSSYGVSLSNSTIYGIFNMADANVTASGNSSDAEAYSLYTIDTTFVGDVDLSSSQYSVNGSGANVVVHAMDFYYNTNFNGNLNLTNVIANATAKGSATDIVEAYGLLFANGVTLGKDVSLNGSQYTASAVGGANLSATNAVAICFGSVDNTGGTTSPVTIGGDFNSSNLDAKAYAIESLGNATAYALYATDTIFNGNVVLSGSDYLATAQSESYAVSSAIYFDGTEFNGEKLDLSNGKATAQVTSTSSFATSYALYIDYDCSISGDVILNGSQYKSIAEAASPSAYAVLVSGDFGGNFDLKNVSTEAIASASSNISYASSLTFLGNLNGDMSLNNSNHMATAQGENAASVWTICINSILQGNLDMTDVSLSADAISTSYAKASALFVDNSRFYGDVILNGSRYVATADVNGAGSAYASSIDMGGISFAKKLNMSNASLTAEAGNESSTNSTAVSLNFSSTSFEGGADFSNSTFIANAYGNNSNAVGIYISSTDLKNANFQNVQVSVTENGIDKTSTNAAVFSTSTLYGADFRGSNISDGCVDTAASLTNVIYSDGRIQNFSAMNTAESVEIAAHIPTEGQEAISAKIYYDDAVVSNATLKLLEGAQLEVTNGNSLVLEDGGELYIEVNPYFDTEPLIFNDNSSFVISDGASITVDLTGDIDSAQSFTVAIWDDGCDISDLSHLGKNDGFNLMNDENPFLGEWDIILNANSMEIRIGNVIPEPAYFAVLAGIVSIFTLFIRRRIR